MYRALEVTGKPSAGAALPAKGAGCSSWPEAEVFPPSPELGFAAYEPLLEKIIKARAVRANHLPGELFSDPAWDSLLRVALAEAQQRRVTIMGLCSAIDAPATTVSRWLRHLADRGLLIRRDAPTDARIKYIELSPAGTRLLRACLDDIQEQLSL